MNPTKKPLNPKNNNSPWLLCPSKSFPGKFYYFNGSTGETAWSLTESDHNNVKKDQIHKVSDNGHPYPEPFGPPGDESTNTSSSSTMRKEHLNNSFNNTSFNNKTSYPNVSAFSKANNFNFTDQSTFGFGSNLQGFSNFNKPCPISFPSTSPMFDQAVFPTYVSNNGTKVIWALTPMLVNEQQHKMLDQVTQYDPPNTFLQPSVILNNQFPSFPHKNLFKVSPTPKVVETGRPMFATKVTYESKDVQTFHQERQTREEACQTFELNTIDVQTEPERAKPVIRLSKFSDKSTIGTSTQSCEEETDGIVEDYDDAANKLSILKENDLRFLLEAKRRKSVDVGEVLKTKSNKEEFDQKIHFEQKNTKKRVTFELADESEESVGIQDNVIPELKCASTSSMDVLESTHTDRIWYIVADSDMLMTDYDYVERNVQDGQNCRLLIPFVVKADIDAASTMEFRGRHDLYTARMVARKLTSSPYVMLQDKPATASSCNKYSILDCCWEYLQDDCDLSLLTTSSELYEKARHFGIDCVLYDPLRQDTMDNPVDTMGSDDVEDTISNENISAVDLESANITAVADIHSESVDLDISNLDITGDNLNKKKQSDVNVNKLNLNHTDVNERIKNHIKVSGITKLNSVFNLDDELARYSVKNDVMETRLANRIDEWKTRLCQATEDALIKTLIKENVKKNMPPQNFIEAIEKIGDTFKKQSRIRTITEKICSHLKNTESKYNKTNPTDFIKLLGYCMILIQSLKEIVDYVELNDADDLLSELIKHIEDPNTDVELNLDKVQTPVLGERESETKVPVGYKTKQHDVLEYLKKHFNTVDTYELETEPTVVRTVGKDLKSIKMLNTKALVMDDNDVQTEKRQEPVVLKNFKIIEAFEEKLKHNEELDYEESLTSVFSGHTYTVNDEIDSTFKKTDIESDLRVSEDSILGESLSSDLNNECVYAFPLMKAFLKQLGRTLLLIFDFVSDSMQDLQQNSVSRNKIDELNIKMDMAHKYILKIIGRLKNIIARESGSGTTLKMLLIQAGDYAEEGEDYKELVMKYLEQAQILEGALKIMMTIEDGDLHVDSSNGSFASIILTPIPKKEVTKQNI